MPSAVITKRGSQAMIKREVRGNDVENGIANTIATIIVDGREVKVNDQIIIVAKSARAAIKIAENLWRSMDAWA